MFPLSDQAFLRRTRGHLRGVREAPLLQPGRGYGDRAGTPKAPAPGALPFFLMPARARCTNPSPTYDPAIQNGTRRATPGTGWLQRGRRVATRYDQYVPCCLDFLYLAGTWIWLNSDFNTAQVCAQPFPIRPALLRRRKTGIFGGTQRKFQGPLPGRIRDGRSHLDLHEDYGTSTRYVSSIPYLYIDNERNVLLVVRYCCA